MHQKNKNISYIIYARKSSESDEKQVQSIDDQVRVMRDLARDMDLTVIDACSEARSAKEPHARPVFQQVLNRIQSGDANGILTWKIDRLSRNPIDSATVQWLLQQGAIQSIQTVGREYLTEDNAVIFSVESSMANQYIRDLSRNVKRGLQSKLAKGVAPQVAPLGYLNTKTELRGENYIVKDPERFHIVRKAWDLMLTGRYTGPEVLDTLNNQLGLRTRKTRRTGGKPLSRSSLYRLLSDPFYTGRFRYNGKLYEGTHEPMVTVEEFERVQALLGRPTKPKQSHHKYAYTGLLHCAECGGLVSATTKIKIIKATGQPKTYTLYYCIRARKEPNACSQRRYINADILDQQVAEKIQSFTILPEFKDWALDIFEEAQSHIKQSIDEVRQSQQKALDGTERQLDKLTDLCTRDLISEREYATKRKELVERIRMLKDSIATADQSAHDRRRAVERAFTFAAEAGELFHNGDIDRKRDVFATMRVNSTLEAGKLAIEPPSWLVPIAEQARKLLDQCQALEPAKQRATTRPEFNRETLSPILRGLVDAVGAALVHSNISNLRALDDVRTSDDAPQNSIIKTPNVQLEKL